MSNTTNLTMTAKIIVDGEMLGFESPVIDEAVRLCAIYCFKNSIKPWEIVLHTGSDADIASIRKGLRRLIKEDKATDRLLLIGEIERMLKRLH